MADRVAPSMTVALPGVIGAVLRPTCLMRLPCTSTLPAYGFWPVASRIRALVKRVSVVMVLCLRVRLVAVRRKVAARRRRHPAWAHAGAVCAARRLHCAARLGVLRRRTRYVRFAHFAQTAAASQMT